MHYSEFKYTDLAIGGATNRNHIITVDNIDVPVTAVDCYTGMFLFKDEYQQHVESTGSVRGADKFEVWSPYVWFDIDADDLNDATLDMQALLRGLKSMDILEHTVVYFSGSKGYHVGINAGIFNLEPSNTLPEIMRKICTQLASLFNIEIDTKIYNHNRLWRLANSIHGKTKFRKTAIDSEKAITITTDKVKQLASKSRKRKPRFITAKRAKPIETCVRVANEAEKGIIKREDGWEAPPMGSTQRRIVKAGLDYLLEHGVIEGHRDNGTLLRASECRKLGISKKVCLEKIIKWNEKNKPPLKMPDIERIVASAYTGPGYDFGTNYEPLRIAREKGRKSLDTIDVEQLLTNEQDLNESEEKYQRKPRTLTEILAEGYQSDMPELVGEYFSWRKRITLLAGREKYSGKSTLCTFEALAALKKGYTILWVSPDEARDDTVYRFIQAGADKYSDQCHIAGDVDLPDSWEELGTWIADLKPDLVVLDSIHSIFPLINGDKIPDSSESAQWQKLVSKLRPIAIVLDLAIVWIHHADKFGNKPIGSVGITAGVDTIVEIGNVPKENRRTLKFVGRRVDSKHNIALDYLGEKEGYKKVDDEWGKTQQNKDDKKTKSELALEWAMDYIAYNKGDIIERPKFFQMYHQEFGDTGESSFKKLLSNLKNKNIITYLRPKPGEISKYKIINRDACKSDKPKPSDLIEGDEE